MDLCSSTRREPHEPSLLPLPLVILLAACTQPAAPDADDVTRASQEAPVATADTHADAHATEAPAADTHADHEAHLADAALPAPPARPWATDAPLRKGMGDIAAALDKAKSDAADGFSADEANALEAGVDSAFRYMLANCKLEPEADVVLHAFLAKLLGLAREVKADPARHAAVLARMDETLAAYPRYFDHPGWTAGHAGH